MNDDPLASSTSGPAQFPQQPRSRMHGDERRQQLIEIALHLFATRGFRGTTTKAIADTAGVSEAMIFRHFPTKNDLYQAILQHKANEVDRTFEMLRQGMEEGDDEAVVLQLARKTLEVYQRDRDFQRVMLLAALEGHDLASVSRETLGLPVFAVLRDYVEGRQAAGAFRPGNPTLQAFSLIALPVYFSIVTSLFGMDLGALPDRQTAAAFTELILDGLRARGDKPARRRRSKASSVARPIRTRRSARNRRNS